MTGHKWVLQIGVYWGGVFHLELRVWDFQLWLGVAAHFHWAKSDTTRAIAVVSQRSGPDSLAFLDVGRRVLSHCWGAMDRALLHSLGVFLSVFNSGPHQTGSGSSPKQATFSLSYFGCHKLEHKQVSRTQTLWDERAWTAEQSHTGKLREGVLGCSFTSIWTVARVAISWRKRTRFSWVLFSIKTSYFWSSVYWCVRWGD